MSEIVLSILALRTRLAARLGFETGPLRRAKFIDWLTLIISRSEKCPEIGLPLKTPDSCEV
jgi:hypothetical protein